MRIVVLAGGIGGARFLLGVRAVARAAGADVTAIVNVGDDVTLHGLRICPDLDSVMYTLGDGADPERGWGRRGETWVIKEELAAYGAEPTWFGLGDRDIATHLVRTRMLDAGHPLSAVTEALCARWQPGVRLLPASDDRVETHVVVDADGDEARRPSTSRSGGSGYRAARAARDFVFVGAEAAKPAPGVLDAIAGADAVLVAPSNPVVSIAPILAVPGLRDALSAGPAPVVGVSPIIGGAPVRGMADKCLAAIDVECSAAGVGGYYRARSGGGILDAWLVDTADAGTTVDGVPVHECPLWMTDPDATAAIVRRGPRERRPRCLTSPSARSPASATSNPAPTSPACSPRPRPGSPTATCVVVTSKVVSKAEGRLVAVPPDAGQAREKAREAAIDDETVRVVARRGPTRIVQTRHGLVLAAAGVDESNVDRSHVVLLPEDPDASARAIRAGLRERLGVDVAVIVSDTMGRPWRLGQTDVAIGAAGIGAVRDYRGETDAHGNQPRGHPDRRRRRTRRGGGSGEGQGGSDPGGGDPGIQHGVRGPAEDGARALVRAAHEDMFSMGTAEARADGPARGRGAARRDAVRRRRPAGRDRPAVHCPWWTSGVRSGRCERAASPVDENGAAARRRPAEPGPRGRRRAPRAGRPGGRGPRVGVDRRRHAARSDRGGSGPLTPSSEVLSGLRTPRSSGTARHRTGVGAAARARPSTTCLTLLGAPARAHQQGVVACRR